MSDVTPMLSYEDAPAAIAWLERAFGFRERPGSRVTEPDGTVTHAEMDVGRDGLIMLATPTPAYQGPRRHAAACAAAAAWAAAPWVINGVLVVVDDVDAHVRQARAAGAVVLGQIEDGFPGRRYRAEDLEGQRWMFIQRPRGN